MILLKFFNKIEDPFSDRSRSKVPTPFTTAMMIETQSPLRPRTPNSNNDDQPFRMYTNVPMSPTSDSSSITNSKSFSPDSVYTFERQSNATRSSRESRPTHTSSSRSKTPGPEFGSTFNSSQRPTPVQPRSKTPTASDYSLTLQNR